MSWIWEIVRLGLNNLRLHKLRSLLTALGIIFGVAAVITMVAIGEGNKQRALADIAQLGARNLILTSIKPPNSGNTEATQMMLAYGLLDRDLQRIQQTVADVEYIVPIMAVGSTISRNRHRIPAQAFGVTPDLLQVTNLQVARGRYLHPDDLHQQNNVAVLGHDVAKRLFPLSDPLVGWIRIDQQLFKVVGVLREVGLSDASGGAGGGMLIGRNLNYDVHIPFSTARSRFGITQIRRQSGATEANRVELTAIYLQVRDQDRVREVADKVFLILEHEHAKKDDYTLTVPIELLEQAERTQRRFNNLMLSIASISLLVGGIGIMNIMLATVTERTREIGIRRALGATRPHIISQFLVETTMLACAGGLIGVALGIAAVLVLRLFGNVQPVLTLWPILTSFFVACSVGVIFGLYPAIKAAHQDPIVALRHD